MRLDDPAVIEDQLWTRWMASLIGSSADEMLDNDVISDYLEKKGMVDFGDYTFDSEQSEAVTAAQRRWLRSVGIDPGASSSITLSKFKAHTRLEQLRGSIVGRSGTCATRVTSSSTGRSTTTRRTPGRSPRARRWSRCTSSSSRTCRAT